MKHTELVFILDRSGSMAGMESDTIGGFNAFLKEQQQSQDPAKLTTILFDQNIEVLHDRMDLAAISHLNDHDYKVRGSTALLDAIGFGIHKIIQVQRSSKPEHQADKVIFMITTDGMENASRRFTQTEIKTLIDRQTSDYHWEFIFLGANIDAVEVASHYGIDADHAVQYRNDKEGIDLNYKNLSKFASDIRSNQSFEKTWKKEIEDDFEVRKDKQ